MTESVRLLTLSAPYLDGWRFGLPMAQAVVVQPTPAVTRVPLAARGLYGLITWEAAPVSLVNLAPLLTEGEHSAGLPEYVLITRLPAQLLAIGVRPNVRIMTLPAVLPEQPLPPPLQAGGIVRAALDVGDDEPLLLLDLARVRLAPPVDLVL